MNVTNNLFMLSVVMLSVDMLSAVMLSVVMMNVVMLNAANNPFTLGVVMLNIIMLIVVENLATSIRMGSFNYWHFEQEEGGRVNRWNTS